MTTAPRKNRPAPKGQPTKKKPHADTQNKLDAQPSQQNAYGIVEACSLRLTLAVANRGRTDTKWRQIAAPWRAWCEFVAADPIVLKTSADKAYLPYFVAAEIAPGSTRSNAGVLMRTAVTLDIDHKNGQAPLPPIDELEQRLHALGYAGLIYTTSGATEQAPRFRVVVPAVPFSPTKTKLAARDLAERLGVADHCDRASFVPSQPMFYPAKREGGHYAYAVTEGALYDADLLPDEEPRDDQPVERVAPMPDDQRTAMLTAAGALIEPYVTDGQRHHVMLAMVGGLRKAGIPYNEARQFAEDHGKEFPWNGVETTYASVNLSKLAGFPALLDEAFGIPKAVVSALQLLLPDATRETAAQQRGDIVIEAMPQPLVPVRYLVDSWLVQGPYVGVLSGRPHVGKSTVATLLAACVATGRDFCGQSVKQAPVFYIALENAKELNDRLLAIAQAWKADAQDLFEGKLFRVTGLEQIDTDQADELIAAMDRKGVAPGLVVVDTVRRAIRGEENKAEDVGRLFKALEKIARHYNAPVLGLAHPPKAGGSVISGSGLYEANARWVGVLEKLDDGATVALSVTKIDAPQPHQPLHFAVESCDLSALLVGELGDHEVATAAIARHVPDAERDTARRDARVTDVVLLQYLQAHPNVSQRDLAAHFDLAQQVIGRRLRKLVGLNLLVGSSKPFKLTRQAEESIRVGAEFDDE